MDYAALAHLHDRWIDYPGFPLGHDLSRDEYALRLTRTRDLMATAGLDALVITSSSVGQWFTSMLEPHEWHDHCPARSAWYILTPSDDYLYMTPTSAGEHFNTTRRSTWVTHIRSIVERAPWPRHEIWALEQMPRIFADLGLQRGRLGFELGDCMTLGISINDYLRLRDLMREAEFVDASAVIRRLMSVHTPEEINRVRRACQAAVWIHNRVPCIVRLGMTERTLVTHLAAEFSTHFGENDGYSYRMGGAWDVRNPTSGDSNLFHAVVTDRVFKAGDLIARGTSGALYCGVEGDVDRVWHLGEAPAIVHTYYHAAWECNRAMADAIMPGARCSDVYAAGVAVEERHGLPRRMTGRLGHGLRNTGGLSVHPDCETVLEPGMIISVEPMIANEYGWFDLEDQYLVTEHGREILHDAAPETLPIIPT